MAQDNNLGDFLTSVADAIRMKKGTSSPINAQDFPSEIESIQSGGVEEKDVSFYDYDGTLLYSYTVAEMQALTELPPAPDHSDNEVPLTFDEWNWTLAELKEQNSPMNVGANYHTTDGKLHYIVEITIPNSVVLFQLRENTDTMYADFGDGTPVEALTSYFTYHTFANVGTYDVAISCAGTFKIGQYNYNINVSNLRKIYMSANCNIYGGFRCNSGLEVISLTKDTIIGGYCFHYCTSLKFCAVPRVTTDLHDAFYYCTSLVNSCHPKGITNFNNAYRCSSIKNLFIANSSVYSDFRDLMCVERIHMPNDQVAAMSYFQNCIKCKKITGGDSATAIASDCFAFCMTLKEFVVPQNVTSIGGAAFSNCYALERIVLPAGVVLASTSIFQNWFNIKEFVIAEGWIPTINLILNQSNMIGRVAMLDLFNKLGDNTEGTTRTISLGSTNLARLADEEKQIAILKNYTLS